jgi:hypothetical protein
MGTTVKWARWLTWLGIVIALAGAAIGIWLQISVGHAFQGINASIRTQQRLSDAVEGLSMVSGGALLAVVAQIMGVMHAQCVPATSTEPPPRIAELLD